MQSLKVKKTTKLLKLNKYSINNKIIVAEIFFSNIISFPKYVKYSLKSNLDAKKILIIVLFLKLMV
jgi:hypothetical protein